MVADQASCSNIVLSSDNVINIYCYSTIGFDLKGSITSYLPKARVALPYI